MFRTVMSSCCIELLLICNYRSLSLVTFFDLKSDISIDTLALFRYYLHGIPSSFHFQLVCVFGSRVTLVESIWLDCVFLPILPSSVFWLEGLMHLHVKRSLIKRDFHVWCLIAFLSCIFTSLSFDLNGTV